MKVLIIDFRSDRRQHISQVITNWGVEVTQRDNFDENFESQNINGDYDLVLLHVGTDQDDRAGNERRDALNYFNARNVLCFSGSKASLDEVRGWVRERPQVWFLEQPFYIRYTDFNNTIEARFVRKSIEMIRAGKQPLEIKNEIEAFNPKLEENLDVLYNMLLNGAPIEISKRDGLLSEAGQ